MTPATVTLPGLHDLYLRDNLLALAGHGDGHVLTVTVALLLAILTGRSDLCIAGVFGAGKTRSLAVLLLALSCELDDFSAVVYTKENVAAKALADQVSDLSPPTLAQFGRLLGRIEEGKGEAYATRIDVRCNDRNRIISSKRILIATGGSATAEMSMRYSTFSQWLSRVWLAFMDESQQYGNYHEIAALAAIQQPALIVFVGDHRQTPGGLSKGRAAAANRQKLLQRPLGLRALNRPGDYLPPARLASLVALLWPDASQDSDSDIACLLRLGQGPHSGVWTTLAPTQELPISLARLLDQQTLSQINVSSSLIAAVLAVLLIATAPEEFGVPECTNTLEAAGLEGSHRWGIILPNSSRVSLLTYKAIVAVRYPELVLHDQDPIQIGHFVSHDHTVEHGGFRTVLWDAPKDLRTAVEDVVAFLTYLQKRHRDLNRGATAQLLVLCNRTDRTAVHNQLLQHGFQTAWHGRLRIATTSSAAGATARIAVIVQTGCGFLSGGRRGASLDDREDCYGRATVALTRAIQHTYIVSPLDMAGMIGMAQTLAMYHYGYHTLKAGQIQFHGPAIVPSDTAAVLDWGLDIPFTSLDKPPLAITMIVTVNGERSLRRYRLVIAQKSKLRLTPEVLATFASQGRDHRLTASGFFPCSIDREYLYGYAADGYRSPLWLCASHNGNPVLVHRQRGTKVFFHQALQDRKLLAIPGIHYFDAHRLRAHLLQAPELQLHPRTSNITGPEGAGDAVEDLSSDEERDTTDAETDAETLAEESWCPPIPDTPDDPTESEIAGAADKLETMMNGSQPQANIFFQPDNLGALPALWLQAKLTISLTSIQDKFAKLFMTIAAELWLRGRIETLEAVFQAAARNFTIRLAEKLAKYLCSLMRCAETLATPETECLLYATYWFRPILSELIGAATESANVNRDRAPSGPVKVVVTNQPHSRPNAGIDLVSGVSALLAWFPASWASKVAPCFIGDAGGATQLPQEVTIQCPNREAAGTQRDDGDQVLQAIKFTDKKVPGLHLDLDEDFQTAGCFTEVIRGYKMGVVEPDVMRGLQPAGATRVTLDVIIPSPTGLTPEKWKQTATLCPLDWPSNYSLLRLWHVTKDLHQFVDQLRKQMNHRHMFSHWEINHEKFASRVLYQLPAHYVPEATLQQNVQNRDFPRRRVRKKPPQADIDEFKAKCRELQRFATTQELDNPVSFALENSWTTTLKSDKLHFLEHTTLRMT